MWFYKITNCPFPERRFSKLESIQQYEREKCSGTELKNAHHRWHGFNLESPRLSAARFNLVGRQIRGTKASGAAFNFLLNPSAAAY